MPILATSRARRTALSTNAEEAFVVTGANGLIGSALIAALSAGGTSVRGVVRHSSGRAGEIVWDPASQTIDRNALEGATTVVHLAGENIAASRWTPETKSRILSSRTEGTQLLSQTLARLARPPRVLVSASAVGFYGNRGAEPLDETSSRGRGFLAEVCEQWEQSTNQARDAGIRVVHLRFGVVLTPSGGALAKMLTPFRLGGGATLGSGEQFMSWISLDDAVAAILHVARELRLEGPVNAVAPNPVTNREFTRTLASVLSRPAFVRVPAFVLRTLFGEMADEMLLASTRALPRRLLKSGFVFRHGDLPAALAEMLGRNAMGAAGSGQ